jgi:DNA-binding XRE family transcriptional regulator
MTTTGKKATAKKAIAKTASKSASKPSETSLKRDVQNMRNELADRLLALRSKDDLSQAALAQMAGVDRKTINRIENGHFSPALDTLVRLSSALSVTPSSLLK